MVENTYVKVYGNENEYKTFQIEFSKNYFPEFIEKEITLEQDYHNFELHFSSSTDEFDDYINQGMFYYFGSNEGNVCDYYDKDTLTLHCHTYDYRNTNTKTITFQDKCGNTKKINLQINIIPSVNYENNYITTSIKFNGKYFILPSEYYKPFYITIYNGGKIKNIYINNILFLAGPFANEERIIYHNFTQTGIYEFQFESIEHYEQNQLIRNDDSN